MPYFVYILFSEKLDRFYTGTTDDAERRLAEHNSAHYANTFTTKGIPWETFLCIECKTSKAAYALEKYIKQMKSSAFIVRLKENPNLLADVISKIEKTL